MGECPMPKQTVHYRDPDKGIVIYERVGISPNLYIKIKLPKQKRYVFSTGGTSLEQAKRMAQEKYEELFVFDRRGLPIHDYSFKKASITYMKDLQRRANIDDVSSIRYYNVSTMLNNKIIPRLGHLALQNTTTLNITEYFDSRIAENNGNLTDLSQKQECGIIRSIFHFSADKGRIDRSQIPIFPKFNTKPYKVDFYLQPDQIKLLNNLARWKAEDISKITHPKLRYYQDQLWHILEILSGTGMRVNELRHMKWKDFYLEEGENGFKAPIFKIGENQRTKTGKREAVGDTRLIDIANIMKQRERWTNDDDYMISAWEGGISKTMSKRAFRKVLMESGLQEYDEKGRKKEPKITLYTYRHSYITNALRKRFNIHILASNTGHTVKTLQATYDHTVPKDFIEELAEHQWRIGIKELSKWESDTIEGRMEEFEDFRNEIGERYFEHIRKTGRITGFDALEAGEIVARNQDKKKGR